MRSRRRAGAGSAEIGHFAEGARVRPSALATLARRPTPMDKTPPPLSLAAALALPLPEGRRSAEVLVDGDLEIRLYAPEGSRPADAARPRRALYRRARHTGNSASAIGPSRSRPGELLYVAANEMHRFEDFSDDFAAWVVFYGPVKTAPPWGARLDRCRSAQRARALKPPLDRASAEAFVDGDHRGPLSRHRRRSACRCRTSATNSTSSPPAPAVTGSRTSRSPIGPGDLLFAAARAEHGFVERSDDFSEWIVFYGPVK